jgi:hypothetical protein
MDEARTDTGLDVEAMLAELAALPEATPEQIEEARASATPAKNGMQRQGDLLVIPSQVLRTKPQTGPITPVAGQVTALKGGSNEHVLSATGAVTWAAVTAGGTDLGVLVVGPGGVATLSHTGHHGSLRVGPGEYVLRRQTAHSAPAAVTVTPTVAQSWTPQDQPRPRPRRMVVD